MNTTNDARRVGPSAMLGSPISPTQLRMARAAEHMTTRELGAAVGLSATAVSRYERGDESAISVATAKRLTEWFNRNRRIFFGPKDGVCVGSDVFGEGRWYAAGLFQLLKDANLVPSSTQLIDAAKRAREPNP